MNCKVLEEANTTGAALPHGVIFAIFMICCMIGSQSVKPLTRWKPPRSLDLNSLNPSPSPSPSPNPNPIPNPNPNPNPSPNPNPNLTLTLALTLTLT